MAAMVEVNTLIAKLQKANWAYHNTEEILMTDEEYDRGIEELRLLSPSHPFLTQVGAATQGGKEILLPYVMGSLDKVRDGKALLSWTKRMPKELRESIIISEKLDGISALLVMKGERKNWKLYLRGDGVKGVDKSEVIPFLQGIPAILSSGSPKVGGKAGLSSSDCMIRGELLLQKKDTPEGSIGRSLVNGWIHRMDTDKEKLKKIHFVSYEIVEPKNLSRGDQFKELKKKGFELPTYQSVKTKDCSEELCKRVLVEYKSGSQYPLDGIVLGADGGIPLPLGNSKNPDDSIAFKMNLEEQMKESDVICVEWNSSRLGYSVPRIQIEPVMIGGATIQWLSGHNAKMIYDKKIGPGARILIRRSGDVIPALERVIREAALGASMPPQKWEWDGVNIRVVAEGGLDSHQVEAEILHALQVLGVEGIGPGLVREIVKAGFTTIKDIWSASISGKKELMESLGPNRSKTFCVNLQNSRKNVRLIDLLIASNLLPRGVGERKLRILFTIEADVAKWCKKMFLPSPAGWTDNTIDILLASLPKAIEWSNDSFPGFVDVSVPSPAPSPAAAPAPASKGYVVFTGTRDKELEKRATVIGWKIEDTISKKTDVLVSSGGAETSKYKKAKDMKEKGSPIKILSLEEFGQLV